MLLSAYSLIIHLRQHPGPFHTHNVMETLWIKWTWGKKNCGSPFEQEPPSRDRATALGFTTHFSQSLCISSLLHKTENLSENKLQAVQAEDTVVFSCWYFYLPPADLGFPTDFLKAFPFRLRSILGRFWREWTVFKADIIKLLILGITQSSVFNSK